MKLHIAIGRVLKIGTILATFGFLSAVLLQIFARFFLESAPSWTEEASRLFFVYAISFASGLALKSNYFVSLDTFYDKFNSKIKNLLNLLIPICTFLMFIIVLIYTIPLIWLGVGEKSPSLKFPMSFAFLSIAIMSISLCYYSFKQLQSVLKNRRT
ncbi:TRAP transporter small permease [Flagellimonas algicola]|uniref:TRAP transporter small permease n=1 Tax=Flagellimonas algicola TaxID=2583815 RepID=A0ABY2WQR9_9FLAO|nr:TRAP transporter small permease subunit [Allomuricauda algicola]TMU57344.1 TRAP transporter small permease [Allomuricauda algicola]